MKYIFKYIMHLQRKKYNYKTGGDTNPLWKK